MRLKSNALVALILTSLFFATSAEAARKYNPGHYIAVMRGADSHKYMTDSIRPGVTGIMKRYTWRSLEPGLFEPPSVRTTVPTRRTRPSSGRPPRAYATTWPPSSTSK